MARNSSANFVYAAFTVFLIVALHGCSSDEKVVEEETKQDDPVVSPETDYHIGTIDRCDYENSSVSWSCNGTHFTTIRRQDLSNQKPLVWSLDFFSLDSKNTSCEHERALRVDFCTVSNADVFAGLTRADVFGGMLTTRHTSAGCNFDTPFDPSAACLYSYDQHGKIASAVREFSCQPSDLSFKETKVEVADGWHHHMAACPKALLQNQSCADLREVFNSYCASARLCRVRLCMIWVCIFQCCACMFCLDIFTLAIAQPLRIYVSSNVLFGEVPSSFFTCDT